MRKTKRNYESLYVVDATLTDEQVDSIAEKYSSLVTGLGAEVQAAGRWDKRRLAYEVKGRREGIYILMYFLCEPAVSKELDRNFRISDEVLRHIIVRVEPEHIDTSKIGQPPSAEEEMAVTEAQEEVTEALPEPEAGQVDSEPVQEPETTPAEQQQPEAEAEPAVEEPVEQEPEPEQESVSEEAAQTEEPSGEEEQSG